MESYDVIIVGGGPAGSTCGWQLRQAGARVLLLDKKAFPRDKPCAGWITPQVVESLQLDTEDYRRDRVLQPISGFCCGLIGGDDVRIDYGRPVSFGIRRYEFDAYLLERAHVSRQLHEPVRNIERRQEQWIVNGDYSAPLLIGAGGHFCPVARRLGVRRQTRSVVLAQEVEYEAVGEFRHTGSARHDTPELFFCPDLLGYGWCFRKGDYLNIGLGRLDSCHLTEHVSRFCDFLRERQKVGKILQRFVGHAYRILDAGRPILVDDGVLLVGDAAGLAYPQSGEGIRPAVESGLFAAQVLTAARQYRREDLAPYEQLLTQRLGQPRARSSRGWLPATWLRFVAARLLRQRWFVEQVVMNKWFLHRQQEALATVTQDEARCWKGAEDE